MKTKVVAKVFVENKKNEYLILLRGKTAPRRPLQWDIPGGIVEDQEKAEDAAIREVAEETGLQLGQLQLTYAQSFKWQHDGRKENVIWLYFRAVTDTSTVKISWEHDEYKWVKSTKLLNYIIYDKQTEAIGYLLSLDAD